MIVFFKQSNRQELVLKHELTQKPKHFLPWHILAVSQVQAPVGPENGRALLLESLPVIIKDVSSRIRKDLARQLRPLCLVSSYEASA